MAQPVHVLLSRTLVSQQNEVSALVSPSRLTSADWCATRALALARSLLRLTSGASVTGHRLVSMYSVANVRSAGLRRLENSPYRRVAPRLRGRILPRGRRRLFRRRKFWGLVPHFSGWALTGGASCPRRRTRRRVAGSVFDLRSFLFYKRHSRYFSCKVSFLRRQDRGLLTHKLNRRRPRMATHIKKKLSSPSRLRLNNLSYRGFIGPVSPFLSRRGFLSTSTQLMFTSRRKGVFWSSVCAKWLARTVRLYSSQHYFIQCVRVSSGVYIRYLIVSSA